MNVVPLHHWDFDYSVLRRQITTITKIVYKVLLIHPVTNSANV
jgi:hypothetical protein